MQNNYPRIYSLSTIGIKQHFNADYIFHQYRTDFSGESGSGKSMVADMIQLILVGSGEFKSATQGNKHRDVKGMLISRKGKTLARGYVFLNVEIKPKKYIVIGAYIEGTSNAAEMFIIQDGYDWNELAPLHKPILNKDLIVDNKVDTLNNLCDTIQFARMKSFRRKTYHQILFDNNIVSLDLTKSETLKTYANILRSFSRGKGFKTESENLKKFLFGDDEQNAILQKYKEEVNNISNDFHEHIRYTDEIKLINDKQILLKTALEKQKEYKAIYANYISKKFNYWNCFRNKTINQKVEINAKLEKKKTEQDFVKKEILRLEIIELKELVSTQEKVRSLTEKHQDSNNIEAEFFAISQSKLQIEVADKWFISNDGQIKKIKEWFAAESSKNENKLALLNFKKYLSDNNILDAFEKSNWLSNYQKENALYSEKIEGFERQISELESLSKFSDSSDSESLVNWALDNLTFPLSRIQESTLKYFQKFGKIKPSETNSSRYVPFPELLFQDLSVNIKKKTKDGFWLNLDGVYEFITYSEDQILNVKSPESIKESLSKYKENIEDRLAKLRVEIRNEEHLKKTLFNFSNLEKHIELFKRKDKLLNYKIDDSLANLTQDSFDLILKTYEDKENVLKQYKSLQKEFEEFTSWKSLLEGYRKSIEKLMAIHFENANSVDTQVVSKKIDSNSQKLLELEKSLKEKKFNKKLFLDSYAKEISTQHKLTKLKYELSAKIKELDIRIEDKDKLISVAQEEIEQTELLNEQLFNSSIDLIGNKEELTNPDDGGYQSVQSMANRSQQAYIEYLKLITKDLPYDETATIGQLANYLLPTVFPSSKVDEDLISNDIVERLSKLTQDIQEIGSRKVDIIGSVFNDVYNVYRKYLTKINDINEYLKKDNKEITGGNKASLTFKKSIHYPENWLSTFRKQLQTQMNYTGLFSDLRDEIDINKMMIRAFQKLGGGTKVLPEDLMNPTSYFDLVFELKLENEDINSGSNGQTYAANALLCLARLSLIEEKGKDGLKIMPIDEAEGLGSNYDMLHKLAKKEEYQIITMAIETAGEITDDGQYIYIMNENNLANIDSFVPPLGIFSDKVTEDIEEYINTLSDDE